MKIKTFVVAPEHILVPFLKSFFSQDILYGGIENIFKFTNGLEQNSLVIEMSETFDTETPNAMPSIILQEGGFMEDDRILGDRRHWTTMNAYESHKSRFMHRFTLHCVAETKGAAKWLQAATAKSLITFRRAIYELGIDYISPIQGSPPQRFANANQTISYNAMISFSVAMEDDWWYDIRGNLEQQISISLSAAFGELEYDSNGNLITPSQFFTQNINIDLTQ